MVATSVTLLPDSRWGGIWWVSFALNQAIELKLKQMVTNGKNYFSKEMDWWKFISGIRVITKHIVSFRMKCLWFLKIIDPFILFDNGIINNRQASTNPSISIMKVFLLNLSRCFEHITGTAFNMMTTNHFYRNGEKKIITKRLYGCPILHKTVNRTHTIPPK